MIDVVIDDELEGILTPPDHIEEAVLAACQVAGYSGQEPELCIRFASDDEVRQLNATWRNKDKVTDVLSFPEQVAPDIDLDNSLGDIALAVPYITEEAERLGLLQQNHALHLIVHSTLHLLGFDHIDDRDADEMQTLEREAMQLLGLHDPYPLEQKKNPEII